MISSETGLALSGACLLRSAPFGEDGRLVGTPPQIEDRFVRGVSSSPTIPQSFPLNKFLYEGIPGTHQWYDGTPHPWEFKRVWHLEPSLVEPSKADDLVTPVLRKALSFMGIHDVGVVRAGWSLAVNLGKVRIEDHLKRHAPEVAALAGSSPERFAASEQTQSVPVRRIVFTHRRRCESRLVTTGQRAHSSPRVAENSYGASSL